METTLNEKQLALLVDSLRLNADRLSEKAQAHESWSQKSAELARSESHELEKLANHFETLIGK